MIFQVGLLNGIQDNDPTFDTEEEALKEVAKWCNEYSFESPIVGVWDKENGELLVIVYEGWEYRP